MLCCMMGFATAHYMAWNTDTHTHMYIYIYNRMHVDLLDNWQSYQPHFNRTFPLALQHAPSSCPWHMCFLRGGGVRGSICWKRSRNQRSRSGGLGYDLILHSTCEPRKAWGLMSNLNHQPLRACWAPWPWAWCQKCRQLMTNFADEKWGCDMLILNICMYVL